MPASFDVRKAKILSELGTPDEQYEDLSPKGSVDSGIRDLILEINSLPQYVTTSSCAGRVSAYLEGTKGAKGGGQWLFTSHDAVDLPVADGAVYQLLGLENGEVAVPCEVEEARFVHLKFEPMVGRSHILYYSTVHGYLSSEYPLHRHTGSTNTLPDPPYPHRLPQGSPTRRHCRIDLRLPRKRHQRYPPVIAKPPSDAHGSRAQFRSRLRLHHRL